MGIASFSSTGVPRPKPSYNELSLNSASRIPSPSLFNSVDAVALWWYGHEPIVVDRADSAAFAIGRTPGKTAPYSRGHGLHSGRDYCRTVGPGLDQRTESHLVVGLQRDRAGTHSIFDRLYF